MAGMNVYNELIRAQFENLTANPSAGLIGRVAFNTVLNKALLDNGSLVRSFLINDAYLVIGNNATANNNVRINRSAASTLQFLLGGDTTAEGSAAAASQLATINANFSGSMLAGVVTAVTTTYQALVTDDLILGSGSAFTITLPAASVGKKFLRIQKTDASLTNIVTISRAGSDTITAAGVSALTSTTLNTGGEEIMFVSDGVSVWYVIHRYIPSGWVSVTVTGSWVANTTYTALMKRTGDSASFDIKIATSGAPTSAVLTLTLPITIDTAKITVADNTKAFGVGSIWDNNTTTYYQALASYNSSTTLVVHTLDDAALGIVQGTVTQANPITFAADDFITVRAENIPVSGWKA